MKKIATMLSILSLSTIAYASKVYVDVTVLPTRVEGEVFNNTNMPIVCDGDVFAKFVDGRVVSTSFSEIIPPSESRSVFMYTSPRTEFTEGWAKIECET